MNKVVWSFIELLSSVHAPETTEPEPEPDEEDAGGFTGGYILSHTPKFDLFG